MKITEETLIRFQKCETTPEEEVAILDWLDADPENQRQLDSLDFQFNAAVLHMEQPQSEDQSSRRSIRSVLSSTQALQQQLPCFSL